MRYKKGLIIICLIICLFTIASVTAADADDAAVQADNETMDEAVASDDADGKEYSDAIASEEENIHDDMVSSYKDDARFEDLQKLIDDADEGSEINLTTDYSFKKAGTSIKLSKSITINGNGHKLDGNHKGTIIIIESDGKNITFKNIIFKDGGKKENSDYDNENGGAIFYEFKHTPFSGDPDLGYEFEAPTSLHIINCEFKDNGAHGRGGAICCFQGYDPVNHPEGILNITDSSFSHNVAQSRRGGAIYCDMYEIRIHNTDFENNEVQRYDNVIDYIITKLSSYEYYERFQMIHDQLTDNKENILTGGAIYSQWELNISDSTFKNNKVGTNSMQTGTSGGAIHCANIIYAYNTTFEDNSVTDWGGGAIFSELECRIYNSTFKDNTANRGCGIYCYGPVFAHNTIFSNNRHIVGTTWAESEKLEIEIQGIPISKILSELGIEFESLSFFYPSEGGAIWAHTGCYIESCEFEDNYASEKGGAIYCDGYVTITGENNMFEDNSVYRGDRSNPVSIVANWKFINKQGGAIYCKDNVYVENASFIHNGAILDGGAIYCEKDCTLINSKLEDNYLVGMDRRNVLGSGVWTGRLLAVKGCYILDNANMVDLGSNTNLGGGIYVDEACNPEISSSKFEGNAALYKGGAIYLNKKDTHLTVNDCKFINNIAGTDGGAIYNKGHTTISNSVFTGNAANYTDTLERCFGGAVYSGKSISVDKSSFDSNWAYHQGGAIYASEGITITNCNFTNNYAKKGGAVHTNTIAKPVTNSNFTNNSAKSGDGGALNVFNKCNPEFISCIFENNTCTGYGAGIYLDGHGDYLKLSNSIFNNNHADKDGGAIYANYLDGSGLSTTEIDSCHFEGNSANKGGALFTCKIANTVSNSQFIKNQAKKGDGGAIYVFNKCSPSFKSCLFEENTCTGKGGAIYMAGYQGTIKFSDSIFTSNKANDVGGAIYTNFVSGSQHTVTEFNNCSFELNTAKEGGAVYTSTVSKVFKSKFLKNSASSGSGGAMYINNVCDPQFYSCTFLNNTATHKGGAIYQYWSGSHYKFTYSIFSNNRAGSYGGAVYAECNAAKFSTVEIQNSQFTANSAVKGGAVYTGGIKGALLNSEFIGNKAVYGKDDNDGDGGAIYIYNRGKIEIVSCRFEKNTANNRGGAIYIDSSDNSANLYASYCTFVDNHADKTKYTGKHYTYGPGHSIFNNGHYKLVDMCWFGSNSDDFKNQFTKRNKGGNDEDYTPTHPLKIGIKINSNEIYKNHTYKVTVYFYTDGKQMEKDLFHSKGRFLTFTTGHVSNVRADINDMTADVIFTSDNPRLEGILDHQGVSLKNLNPMDKQSSNVHITSAEDAKYPNAVKVTYEITHMSSNASYAVKDVQGKIVKEDQLTSPSELFINGLTPGEYSITISNPESEAYQASSATATFSISRGDIDLMVVVMNETYPDDVECVVHASVDGEYILTVAGCSTVVVVKDHVAHFHRGTLDADTYEAIVSFEGNDLYNPVSNRTTFIVSREGTNFEIEVTPAVINYGETATIIHTITSGTSGKIKYYLHNGTYLGESSPGENFTLPVLNGGSYTIIANYTGDHDHFSAHDSTHLIVNRVLPSFDAAAEPVTYGDDATVTHTLPKNAEGTIRYYLENGTFLSELPVTESLTLSGLTGGTHKIIANYSGDINYLNATARTTVTVNRAEPAFEAAAEPVTYGDDATVTHTLPKNAEGTIRYYLENGAFIEELPVKESLIIFELTGGTHTIIANYSGDENYLNATARTTVTVNRAETEIMTDYVLTEYNEDDYLTIALNDYMGYPLAGASVSVDLNGIKYYTTDENGQIKISTSNLRADTYDVYVSFNGTDNYLNSSASTNVFISKRPSVMVTTSLVTTYQIHKYLMVNLKDDVGRPISGVEVFTVIHGVSYKAKTDSNGDGRLIIRLNPLDYVATIVFDNENYTLSMEPARVTVYKADPKMTAKNKKFKAKTKVKKYTITLKDNIGKVIKNAKVTLKIKGKTYVAKTNSNGKATFKIKKLTKNGKFTATVTFKGNIYFNAVTKKVKITCSK